MRFSSGSWSLTVLPRSTLPGAPMAPDLCSSASARVVLAEADAPTSASVRTASISAARPFDRLGMRGAPRRPVREVVVPIWDALRLDGNSGYGIDRSGASYVSQSATAV